MSPAERRALVVYDEAGEEGCTYDDLVVVLHPLLAVSGIATLPNRLLRIGYIEETGLTRTSHYGKQNVVRRITAEGRRALRASGEK